MSVVEARGLHRFFRIGDDEVAALRDVSLEVRAGELVALVGASGSGKSTLLSCLAGLDEPDAGYVNICGSRMSHRPEAERTRLRATSIGMLVQAGVLFDHLTVRENLLLQRAVARHAAANDIDLLLRVLGIGSRADVLPRRLSGGEAARASLAIALTNNSPILLCDEPTAELDGATEAAILSEICRHRDRGAAVVIATHSLAVAGMSDRTVELADGRLTP